MLGALFDNFCNREESHIYISNLSNKLRVVMQKNGFAERLGYNSINDRFHTTIPYKEFRITESTEFEKYLIMGVGSALLPTYLLFYSNNDTKSRYTPSAPFTLASSTSSLFIGVNTKIIFVFIFDN